MICTMMRLFLLTVYVATAAAAAASCPAFISSCARRSRVLVIAQSKAEEHLEEMKETWAELQQKEKELLEKSVDEVSRLEV